MKGSGRGRRGGVCAGLCGKREEFGLYFDGSREPWNTPFNTYSLSGSLLLHLPWLSVFILQVSSPTLTSSKRPLPDTPDK